MSAPQNLLPFPFALGSVLDERYELCEGLGRTRRNKTKSSTPRASVDLFLWRRALLLVVPALLWMVSPAAAEPFPRVGSLSPADSFSIPQSRPLEGFSVGVGILTQVGHLRAPGVSRPQDDYRVGADVLLTGSLWGYFQLDVALPVRVLVAGPARADGSLTGHPALRLEGLRLSGKLAVPGLRREADGEGLGLALLFGAELPTAAPGARVTTLRPGAVIDWQRGWGDGYRVTLAGTLGGAIGPLDGTRRPPGAITYGAAAKLLFVPHVQLAGFVGVDGVLPVAPKLAHGAASFFGGLQWWSEHCYNVAATGGVRLGEPGGLAWFGGVLFGRLWGGECESARGRDGAVSLAARSWPATVSGNGRETRGIGEGASLLASAAPLPTVSAWHTLADRAGVAVEVDAAGEWIAPEEATRIRAVLVRRPASLRAFAPRKLLYLLGEIIAARKAAAVAELIASSTEYWERYRALPAYDQIREASRILTTLLLVYDGAAAATARLGEAASKLGDVTVDVLRLTGHGELAWATVVVPTGQVATAVAGAPAAVFVLHMSGTSLAGGGAAGGGGGAGDDGDAGGDGAGDARSGSSKTAVSEPGKWRASNEHMSPRAAEYQERITGHPATECYEVKGVKFDGYDGRVLLEAKGPGYASFVEEGKFKRFFTKEDNLRNQAKAQIEVAGETPIEWHIAEEEFFETLKSLFKGKRYQNIRVIFHP